LKATRTIAVVVGVLCAAGAAAPDTQPADQKLLPGKTPGTFHIVYHGTVRFTMEPQYPTVVSLVSNFTGTEAETTVRGEHPFTLEADLPPGTYWLASHPFGGSDYWPENGGQLFIDKEGNLTRTVGAGNTVVHVHKMTGLTPADSEIAEADAPVLKWKPVPGDKFYRGDFEGGGSSGPFEVNIAEYKLPKLQPPHACYWEVWAIAEGGNTIASGFAAFYARGTDPALTDARLRGGFVGVAPVSASTDQKTAAIRVDVPIDGSPAMKAGLRADDLIVAIDDKPLVASKDEPDRGDVMAFVEQIRANRPGTVITFTVQRGGSEQKIPVTVDRLPDAMVQAYTKRGPRIKAMPWRGQRPVLEGFKGGYLGVMINGLLITKDPGQSEVLNDGRGVIAGSGVQIPCILVADIAPGSPALDAGLRPGDAIVALNGKSVPSMKDPNFPAGDPIAFLKQISAMRPGTVATLTLRRGSNELKLPITIGRPPARATQPAVREP
jgi:S1-C subfamily serine protease